MILVEYFRSAVPLALTVLLVPHDKLDGEGSLVPRPCAFVACSMNICANFVLQVTNAQGLGTELRGGGGGG